MPPSIAVVNHSTLISDADAATMTKLVDAQVYYHFSPAWGLKPTRVVYYPSTPNSPPPPPTTPIIALFDDSDTPGAAGWHSTGTAGVPNGKVFARPSLNVGGGVIMGDPSVCSVLSHEVLEMIGDGAVNEWVSDLGFHGTPTPVLHAREMCDACEGFSYTLIFASPHLQGRVSDFLLPAWFDPSGNPGPWDYMKKLTGPFTIGAKGYEVQEAEGGTKTQVFGERYEDWRLGGKGHTASRTYRRLAGA